MNYAIMIILFIFSTFAFGEEESKQCRYKFKIKSVTLFKKLDYFRPKSNELAIYYANVGLTGTVYKVFGITDKEIDNKIPITIEDSKYFEFSKNKNIYIFDIDLKFVKGRIANFYPGKLEMDEIDFNSIINPISDVEKEFNAFASYSYKNDKVGVDLRIVRFCLEDNKKINDDPRESQKDSSGNQAKSNINEVLKED